MALLSNINATSSNPSSVLNFITGSDNATGWTGVNATVTTETATANVPAFPIRNTAIKISSTSFSARGQTSFTVPSGVGELVGISFYYKTSSTDAWTLEVRDISNVLVASWSLVGSTTGLPFNTSITLVKGAVYTLRYLITPTATDIYLSSVTVGTSVPTQGAVTSDWFSFTPLWQGAAGDPVIGNGTLAGRYRRVGSSVEMQITIITGTTTTYGSSTHYINWSNLGITPNLSAMAGGANARMGDGTTFLTGSLLEEGISPNYSIPTRCTFSRVNGAAVSDIGSGNWTAATASQQLRATITFPVNEWAGAGVVNLGPGAQVEYAYNTDVSATASVTGSGFGYGPGGVNLPSTNWVVGTNWQRRVLFQYPIQPTDSIQLEVLAPGATAWTPMETGLASYIPTFSTYNYGVSYQAVSGQSNAIDVIFTAGGALAPASFGSATGYAWTNYSAYKWRIKKANPSSPVGFGKANGNEWGLTPPMKTTTLDLSGTGGYLSASAAVGVYYQDDAGNHHLRFNINITLSSATRGSCSIVIAGVTFKTTANGQAFTGWADSSVTITQCYCASGSSGAVVLHTTGNTTYYMASGDVLLNSKPTWA